MVLGPLISLAKLFLTSAPKKYLLLHKHHGFALQ